jgi:hypothetical protein
VWGYGAGPHRRDDVFEEDAKDARLGGLDVLQILVAVVVFVPAAGLGNVLQHNLLRNAVQNFMRRSTTHRNTVQRASKQCNA